MSFPCSQPHVIGTPAEELLHGVGPDGGATSAKDLEDVDAVWLGLRHEPDRYTLLREIKRKRLFRFATGLSEPATIIVKTWAVARGSMLSRIKRRLFAFARASEKEYQIARQLGSSAPMLNVPHAIARYQQMEVLGETCEVLLTEDLGPCETLLDVVNSRLSNEDVRRQVEDFVVDSAKALLLDARVIDEDHSTVNMVRSVRAGKFHRIDFEVALPWEHCLYPARAIGGMLGRLTASYVFAFQPDMAPVERMVGRLVNELRSTVPRRAWAHAYDVASLALERQRTSKGIDMRPNLSIMEAAGRD